MTNESGAEVRRDASGGTEAGAQIDIGGDQKEKIEDGILISSLEEVVLLIFGTIERGLILIAGGNLKDRCTSERELAPGLSWKYQQMTRAV